MRTCAQFFSMISMGMWRQLRDIALVHVFEIDQVNL